MDNLAHSLVGAALGRAAGGGRVRYPALLGAVAGNLPDLSELVTGDMWPGAAYLAEHRGQTHSLFGAAVELAVVLGLAWLVRRRKDTFAAVAVIAGPAIASHLLMDWTGSYGLRPFLPWSGRWYYGDVIPIVDVLFWIVPLAVLAWGSPRTWRWGLLWGAIAVVPTSLVLLVGAAGADFRAAWLAGLALAAAGWWVHWFGPEQSRRAALAGLALLAVYGAVATVGRSSALGVAREQAEVRLGPGGHAAVLARTGGFFNWELMYSTPDSVAGQSYSWISGLDPQVWVIARNLDRPEVRTALETSADGRAMNVFARFLTAEVRREGRRSIVILRDARYARGPGDDGWAVVAVTVDGASSP